MSKCKLSLWQKIKGLYMYYQYKRTIEKFGEVQKILDKLNYKKSDYWL
jgi:hypothetical protein